MILELTGQLTLGPLLSTIRNSARTALTQPKVSGLILEVGGVTVTDSSGLGELTVVYSLAVKNGCPLRLVGVSSSLQKMLHMTRIDELLPSCPSVSAAKASIKGEPHAVAQSRGK